MKAWCIDSHGGSEVYKLKELQKPVLTSGKTIIRVRAIGINHMDVWVRKGVPGHRFPLPLIPGCDIVGQTEDGKRVVVHPGISCGQCSACIENFEPLCPQYGILGETQDGGAAEFFAVPTENLIPLPLTISDDEAAALGVPYITAWSMLYRKAKIKETDLVVVRAAGSGVSVAAIQLATLAGANVIATVRSDEKEKEAKKHFVKNCQIVQTEKESLKDIVKSTAKSLGKRGADIVIDHVGGETFEESIKLLNWGGRLVICGATSGADVQLNLKPLFFKNLSVLGSTMGARTDFSKVIDLVASKKITPILSKTFLFNDYPKAVEFLEQKKAFGKIIVKGV